MSRTRNATLTRVSGLIVATGFYLLYLAAPAAADQRISWTAMRNVALNGDVVQKTGGCQGCEDAGAISQQMLPGDGSVQFSPGETNTFWYAGLTRRTDGAQHADMDFAFRFNGAGQADVVENGTYGTVRLSADPNDVADPLGSHQGRRAGDAPLHNSPAGALVARIGNATILVGNHRTITRYPFSGRLYLGVNDDYLNDNSGQYTVSVDVEPYRR